MSAPDFRVVIVHQDTADNVEQALRRMLQWIRLASPVKSLAAQELIEAGERALTNLVAAIRLSERTSPKFIPRNADELHSWGVIEEVVLIRALSEGWSEAQRLAAERRISLALPPHWSQWDAATAENWVACFLKITEQSAVVGATGVSGPVRVNNPEEDELERLARAEAHRRGERLPPD